jgi:transcriptional regulator with XRE-family HTH domain
VTRKFARKVPGESKFARRLAAEMNRRKLTYDQFAIELGVPKAQLWDWLHDIHDPRVETIISIATKLDCSVTDLIDAA